MKLFTRMLIAIVVGVAMLILFTPQIVTVRAATAQTYIVLYKGQAVPANAASTFANAGGSLVYSYNEIGVAIAQSDNASFGSNLAALDSSVQGAVATARFATHLDESASNGTDAAVTPSTPAPGNDNLSGLQWDM
ncbi:MAG TPA: hypothetical protein VF932_16525, partial [Anaerolineae bacterium]